MKKLVFLFLIVVSACEKGAEEEFISEISAEAQLFSIQALGDDQYEVTEGRIGTATFGQSADNSVRLTISLEGMPPNTESAVHIHNGTLEAPGRHWNQGYLYAACDSISLGSKWDKPFLGDVGNVYIDGDGNGTFILTTNLWRINSGDINDILNKVIIIHQDPQDFSNECTPYHVHDHTNQKVAGGTIELVSDVPEEKQLIVKMQQVPDFLICN